jgi:hypothetical protein
MSIWVGWFRLDYGSEDREPFRSRIERSPLAVALLLLLVLIGLVGLAVGHC